MRSLLLIVVALLLVSCATKKVANKDFADALSSYSVVVTNNQNFTLDRSRSFYWKEALNIFGTDLMHKEKSVKRISQAIEDEIRRQGYDFNERLGAGEYALVATVIIGKKGKMRYMDYLAMASGLEPGLPSPQGDLKKGTLVVSLYSKTNNKLLWRGKVQMFTDEQLPSTVKVSRIQFAIQTLFKELFSSH